MSILATLPGCTSKKNKTQSEHNTFRVIISDTSETLDWNQSNVVDGVKELLTESPLTYAPVGEKWEVAPALIQTWRSENGGRTWIFQLRSDVLWSDGVKLTAQHLVDSIERFLQPETRAFLASTLYVVRGARDFNTAKLADFSQVGVTATNDSEVRIELVRPVSYFAHLLTLHQLGPIRKDLIAKHPNGEWLKPAHFVTVGPYLLEKYSAQQALRVKANPSYYLGERQIKSIEGLFVQEPAAGVNLFESGAADLTLSLPSEDFARLKNRDDYHEAPGSSPGFLGFDFLAPEAQNKFLRQAISLALDRREIAKIFNAVVAEKYILAQPLNVMPPYSVYSEDDLREAKKRLTLAKLPEGFHLKLQVRAASNLVRAAENIQHQLKQKLGLNIELNTIERTTLRGLILNHKVPFFLYVMGADHLDPHSIMEFYTSSSSQNLLGWKSKPYDELVFAAEKEATPKKRIELYQKANRILTDEAYYIPLFAYSYPYLLSKKFAGFAMPPIYRIDLRNLRYATP